MDAREHVIFSKVIESKSGNYVDFPEKLFPEIKEYLEKVGINRLYSHQAEMFETAQNCENIVITTSTASGKTLSFLLPILQDILENPLNRAIFIYPTKALASDQYKALKPILEHFGKNKISAGIYDGDTPVNERRRIRDSANIILTNPEMINSAFLPHHNNFGFDFIFSNLKYVVVDELHTYRGAFGSHLANVFKRLQRICKYYSSSPQFFCSSATIANPIELAENICGKTFVQIEKDGSPAPQKSYHFIQPPEFASGIKKSVSKMSAELVPKFVLEKRSFIDFCKSRKAVEVVLRESRDKLKYDGIKGADLSGMISGYRGGYTPIERKEIESKMISGQIRGLVSTNALELGIDMGKIDTTILTGYPGTRSSFWQQSGRAGRSGKDCATYLILDNLPFDQYIAIYPEWLFEVGSENAVISKDNLFIQIAHTRAACAELPLSLDDIQFFPDLSEIVPTLMRGSEVRSENGRFVWCGKEFPAGDYSLRNADKIRYTAKDNNGKVLTEMDELQAFRELHKGSIYIHDGMSYIVLNLDVSSKIAYLEPTLENYYTETFESVNLRTLSEHLSAGIGRTTCFFGDVKVNNVVGGHKKIQFHNHQNLGFNMLEEKHIKEFETEGSWIDLPRNVVNVFLKVSFEYISGIAHAIDNSAQMITMTTNNDIGCGIIQKVDNEESSVALCIYDKYVGGLGFSEKSFELIEKIVNNAMKAIEGCKCSDGCPVCVGSYTIDKQLVLWGLQNIFEEVEPPTEFKVPLTPPITKEAKVFEISSLLDNWNEFRLYVKSNGEYLSEFISTITSVEVFENKIVLLIENDFYKTWLLSGDNHVKLRNMFNEHVDSPNGLEVELKLNDDSVKNNEEKIVKRYNDLVKG